MIYKIDLGSKSKIKKITFVGDKIYKDKKLKNIIHLKGAAVDISSSEVREKIKNKYHVKNYLNKDVLNFIIENNLYEN